MIVTDKVKAAAETFPKGFGLRAFPGMTFHINVGQSYESGGEVQLYVFTAEGKAFAKDTPERLRLEVVAAPE